MPSPKRTAYYAPLRPDSLLDRILCLLNRSTKHFV
jgi:hypothetical protein